MISVTGLPALLLMMVVALIWVIPMWKLLPKFDMSKYLSLLGLIPFVGGIAFIVFLWIMAYREPTGAINSETFS